MAQPGFKDMIVDTNANDIVYTAAISGVHGNFLKPSIDAAGVPADQLNATKQLDLNHEKRAWKNVWSAGQGVGSIEDVPATADLCARLIREYHEAMSEAAAEIAQSRAA
jgi:nitronate monooxygenase